MRSLRPGQPEAQAAALSAKHYGLLFTRAELDAFNVIAKECGAKPWEIGKFKPVAL